MASSSISIYTHFGRKLLPPPFCKIKRSPRKAKPRKLTPNPNPLLKSRAFPQLEATTYTRLPPKDDFISDPSQLSPEITLSDLNSSFPDLSGRKSQENVEKDEIGSDDEELGFDYGKFELFEVGSDDDDEEEDFDDDDDDEVVLGFGDGEVQDFTEVEEGEEGEGEKEKEKGVPAVMRCFDRAKIFVKAGDGGNGCVAIRREKFVPLGGPSGGDGGRGGHVYVEVDDSMNSLLPFRQSIHYRAGRGSHGKGSNMHGAKGDSVVVKVPPGTVVREAGNDGEEGEVLFELLNPGQRALLLPGGRGGRGNAAFKSGTNRVPKIAENGEEGAEM